MTIVLPESRPLHVLPELRLFPVSPPELLEIGELTIDLEARRVTVAGRRVTLAPKEYELLVELARAPNRMFRKAELLRSVWGFRAATRTRTLDSHASRLRRKLLAAGATNLVVNEWGYGYRLVD